MNPGARRETQATGQNVRLESRVPRPESASVPLFDAYAPQQIAVRVRDVGVAKATAPVLTTLALAVLAGAFISLGALFYTVTVTDAAGGPAAPSGLTRLAGGVAFSLGLILVVVGGAELFTGNNLIAMAWAAGRLSSGQVLRNWIWVYVGNLLGALGTVALVLLAGIHQLGDGALGETAVRIARAKAGLDPLEALARGILCNVLVCLAVWLCMGARSVTDKILAIVFPISAFVACGFEHSIANMYFLPVGLALTASGASPISLGDVITNLELVTLGNILGGTVLVAMVYWFVYLRQEGKGLEASGER
ncbi:MAG: formate/nitrite transporter family protein [Nitrospirae bacterium]|nr:formate/nitrite transporter family protein [Nitrospirota bacterium]